MHKWYGKHSLHTELLILFIFVSGISSELIYFPNDVQSILYFPNLYEKRVFSSSTFTFTLFCNLKNTYIY